MNHIFGAIFTSAASAAIAPLQFLLCVAFSLLIGALLAFLLLRHTEGSGSLTLTLALLPAAVCVIIMTVNGSLGMGVAVAGAFGLVRFRSIAGTAREICAVFIAMTAGLLTGTGYLAYALLFCLMMGGASMAYTRLFAGRTDPDCRRVLRITIPENLDYDGVFEPVFGKYANSYQLRNVKSTNMGSLFRLTYELDLRSGISVKAMLDELRCRNGNLEVSLSYRDTDNGTL